MAVYSRHPASAPPTAPVREKTGHLLLRAWCTTVLVVAFASPAVSLAGGPVLVAVVAAAVVAASVAIWISLRPPLQWRRLPWYLLGLLTWALVSLSWSAWPATTAVTWVLSAATAAVGIFIAAALTWREIVRAMAAALQWVLALTVLFDAAVAIAVGGPMLAGFVVAAPDDRSATVWSTGTLFSGWLGAGPPLRGLWGDPDQLATVCVVAIVVIAVRYAAGAPGRVRLWVWLALAAYLLVRAASVTGYLTALAVAVVLCTVLLMRTATAPRARTKWYVVYAAVACAIAAAVWIWREPVFGSLDRAADLAAREAQWARVADLAGERPFLGWGFATPPIAWADATDAVPVSAQQVWIDVSYQLGAVGVVLLALVLFAFVWRSWFFAVDRPRWDLRADRPYSPLTLVPTLLGAVLLVQSLTDAAPLTGWGWLLLALVGSKIKQAPLIGVGPAEQTLAIERGELLGADAGRGTVAVP